ncbi:MAG: serine/threonine-protein kinase [Polyangiaceae bacterium]
MTEELKTLASVTSSHREREAPASGLCLGTDEILAFVQGQIPDEGLDQVHAHVDECEVCQCLLAEAAHALDSEPISESTRTSWNTVFQPSTIVGKRYRILRLVARGGMGEVYEAYDTALHERVALKTVTSTSCDNAQAVRLLKAEVQLARRISHPNVCRIYDLGTHQIESTGHEIHFLVMEFVDGECLGRRLRASGAFPLDQAQSVAQQLLFGLRAAHDAGILHRDFKSDNVMLRTESDGRLTPVILDFGLAKALNESGLIATTQTSQVMVGTIGYMAPEQIEGAPLSTASDSVRIRRRLVRIADGEVALRRGLSRCNRDGTFAPCANRTKRHQSERSGLAGRNRSSLPAPSTRRAIRHGRTSAGRLEQPTRCSASSNGRSCAISSSNSVRDADDVGLWRRDHGLRIVSRLARTGPRVSHGRAAPSVSSQRGRRFDCDIESDYCSRARAEARLG